MAALSQARLLWAALCLALVPGLTVAVLRPLPALAAGAAEPAWKSDLGTSGASPGRFSEILPAALQIRVLLLEESGSVGVWQHGVRYEVSLAAAEAGVRRVRVDGGRLSDRWRAEAGSEPLRVGSLSVRGAVEVLPAENGKLLVVNELPVESYLAGTLGREMYGSWSAAALRAQAVASRTYAIQQMRIRRGKAWHVRSGTLSQVYAGVEAESESVRAAVRATRGEILIHDGEPILAAFHSSSGGQTASAEEVWGSARAYLVSLEVENEWESPDAYWRAGLSRTTLGRAVAAARRDIGSIRRAEVLERTGSGRVALVRLTGERGSVTMTGRDLRSALGESTLKSTLFELRPSDEGFVFVGSGNGHGVGMSQWGARAMAERGDSYQKILGAFYPGTALRSLLDAPAHVSARRGDR